MRILIFIIGLIVLTACGSGDEPDTVVHTVAPFESIVINSSFQIYLQEGTTYTVRVKGDPDRLPQISVEVTNNVLRLTDNNTLKWLAPRSNKIELVITAPAFGSMEVNQTCLIETMVPLTTGLALNMGNSAKLVEANLAFNGGSFYYWNNYQCGGKITLTGNTSSLQLFSYATMAIDASALETEFALIENNSKGDLQVNATGHLEYSIRNLGNIYYRGNPEIVAREITSTGRLIKVD